MSLSEGIDPGTWIHALRASIGVVSAEVYGVDGITLDGLLEGVDRGAVIAALAQQIRILLSTLPEENSQRLLEAWGAAGRGAVR